MTGDPRRPGEMGSSGRDADRRAADGRDADAIVVGAGFAGCEVAAACARGGLRTLLVTTSMDTVAKPVRDRVVFDEDPGGWLGELVRELPRDRDGAVRGWDLHRAAKERLEHTAGLHLLQSDASALLVDDATDPPHVAGIDTWEGIARRAPIVVLAAGSFLGARLRAGALREQAGRLGEMAYDDLYDDLRSRGLRFEACRAEGDPGTGAPSYEVRFERLHPDVVAPLPGTAEGAVAIPRIGGLYAAGLVAGTPLGPGTRGYRAAASAGRSLGGHLVAEAVAD